MSDQYEQDMTEQEEQRIAGLIARGGLREQPPAAVREAVRAAVRREWQEVVASRPKRRERWPAVAGVAAATVAALAAWLALPLLQAPAAVVASVARVEGPVEVGTDSMFGGFRRASAPSAITAGEQLRSGPGGRAGLTFGTTSVRLDEGSIVTLVAADRLRLERGAVYVDSAPGAAGRSRLLVETPYGAVEHLGTQYETRLLDAGLRVRVREGNVRVTGAGMDTGIEASAGDEMLVGRDGAVERRTVRPSGSAWGWTESVAPPFDIENRSLGEFLRWAARETGRELVFVSPAAQTEAERVMLRGSIAGLGASRALPAVLATTRFDATEAPGEIRVDFTTGDR